LTGEDPNGTWTLTVSDDSSGNGGQLTGWDLALFTATCADVATTLTTTSRRPEGNQPVSYTAAIRSRSNAALAGGHLAITLPPGMNFESLDSLPSGWSCTPPAVGASGTIDCTKASMPAGETAPFTVTVRPAAIGVATVTATGTVSPADL